MTPINRAGAALIFLYIIKITTSGTIKSIGDIKNFSFIMSEILSEFSTIWPEFKLKPMKVNIRRQIIIEGSAVNDKYLIWENKSLPETAGAKLVVSESGDILSPKYAPERIAPAIIPSEIFRALPIPISAIPIVADVVHELPVAIETIIQIIHAASRKISGLSILIP